LISELKYSMKRYKLLQAYFQINECHALLMKLKMDKFKS